MRATFLHGAGDVRVEEVPDPQLQQPTDAVVRVVAACICGSDLHPYASMRPTSRPRPMGHEFVGVVEVVGDQVGRLRPGDFVVSPFATSDGECEFCREGLPTSCVHAEFFSAGNLAGCQADLVRVPFADATLVKAPGGVDSPLLPSLLTLSDVMLTGHHCAVAGGVGPGRDVTVIGDGAVGLCAVLAARRLGADRIVLVGRHESRVELGQRFGATEVVTERGTDAVHRIRDLTDGRGTHVILDAVGRRDAYDLAVSAVRAGGVISRVGMPQYDEAPVGFTSLFSRNITLTGGVAPVRTYLDEMLTDVVAGRLEPGAVFDRTVALDDVAEGYRLMAQREALKVLVRP